jgi:hypothetical protein
MLQPLRTTSCHLQQKAICDLSMSLSRLELTSSNKFSYKIYIKEYPIHEAISTKVFWSYLQRVAALY